MLASEPFPPCCCSCLYFINWYQSHGEEMMLVEAHMGRAKFMRRERLMSEKERSDLLKPDVIF